MAAQYWDGTQWIDLASGEQGPQGPAGNGIASAVLNPDYTLTLTFTNGSSYTTPSIRGETGDTGAQGEQGVGITSVTLVSGTHAPGTTDTYRVTLTDESTYDFTVYNGADGQGSPGSQLPQKLGTASAGSAAAYAREDHVHPGFVELWTNSSPTANFAAQTVSIDLSAWSWIAITIIDNSNNDGDNTSLCKVGRSAILEASNFGSTQYKYMRKATVTTSGVTFTTGYRNTTDTTGASYAIPQAIYGVC